MKTKKVLSGLLAAILTLSFSSEPVHAAEIHAPDKQDLSAKMNYYEMEELELPDLDDEYKANYLERQYHGETFRITKDIGISAYADEQSLSENTDPNYAFIVENDMVVQGTVTTEGEARWYAFILNERSKVNLKLMNQMLFII